MNSVYVYVKKYLPKVTDGQIRVAGAIGGVCLFLLLARCA